MVPGLRRARPELMRTENERTARSCPCADIQPSPGGRAVLPKETSSPRARAPTPPPCLMRESHQLLKFRSKSSQRKSGVSSSMALATSPELSTRGGKAADGERFHHRGSCPACAGVTHACQVERRRPWETGRGGRHTGGRGHQR